MNRNDVVGIFRFVFVTFTVVRSGGTVIVLIRRSFPIFRRAGLSLPAAGRIVPLIPITAAAPFTAGRTGLGIFRIALFFIFIIFFVIIMLRVVIVILI